VWPLRRVPLFANGRLSRSAGGRGLPVPRRCRPQGSCPSRRCWPFVERAPPLRGASSSPKPDASRPSFVPLAPWNALQSFPFPRSRARSRWPLLPCGFAFDRRRRGAPRIACRFRRRADPSPRLAQRRARLRGRERRFPATPAEVVVRAGARRPQPRPLETPGSPVNGRHARFGALLPSGVRSRTRPSLARAGIGGRCSPGLLSP